MRLSQLLLLLVRHMGIFQKSLIRRLGLIVDFLDLGSDSNFGFQFVLWNKVIRDQVLDSINLVHQGQ